MEKIDKLRNGVALFLVVALIAVIASCDYIREAQKRSDTRDSIKIATIVENIINPSYTSIEEVQDAIAHADDMWHGDSVLRSMTEEQINHVATVLINKTGKCTLDQLVEEYEKNRKVYDNLTPLPQEHAVEVKEVMVTSRDTMIDTVDANGNRIRIIKTKEK